MFAHPGVSRSEVGGRDTGPNGGKRQLQIAVPLSVSRMRRQREAEAERHVHEVEREAFKVGDKILPDVPEQ